MKLNGSHMNCFDFHRFGEAEAQDDASIEALEGILSRPYEVSK